jgi:uncharacterized Zn-binding protein involved in type VI secretion
MAAQGRLGDEATGTHQGSSAKGPAQQGAAATFVNGQPALRVGDTGDHTDNSGDWRATSGSTSVFIEGKKAHRLGDDTSHDANGQLAQGSPNVDVGTSNGSTTPKPHDLEIEIDVVDATDRKIKDVHVKVECPHPGQPAAKDALVAFNETTKLTNVCSAAPITVYKSLERGDWDAGAKSGAALPNTPSQPADGSVSYIHAPAPESKVALELKPEAERQILIAKADPAKAVIRMTTAYNWMELVYKAFKLTMPTGANQVALLGVREGILTGGQRTTRDDDFETFHDHTAKGGKGDGGHETKYDDLIFLAVAPKDPAIMQRVEAFECSIDPGDKYSTAAGMPLLIEGAPGGSVVYQGFPATHHGPCLHLYSGHQGPLRVTRIHYEAVTDPKKAPANHRTFETTGDANVHSGKQSYQFYQNETEDPGILIHSSWTRQYVNSGGTQWSVGCTVLRHSYDGGGDDAKRFLDFGTTATTAANKQQVPYLVVSSKYVKSYAEWVKEVDKSPDKAPKPSSVLRRDGLETPTNGAKGKYLPSIVSKAFADEVNKKYDDLQKNPQPAAPAGPPAKGAKAPAPDPNALTPAQIQNLKTSLDAVLFEVVED